MAAFSGHDVVIVGVDIPNRKERRSVLSPLLLLSLRLRCRCVVIVASSSLLMSSFNLSSWWSRCLHAYNINIAVDSNDGDRRSKTNILLLTRVMETKI